MRHSPARIALGATVLVIAGALVMPPGTKVAAAASLQNSSSKQPSQAEVEAQLARFLEELKRDNARRGITTEPVVPAKPETPKLDATKSETGKAPVVREASPLVASAPAFEPPTTPAVSQPPATVIEPVTQSSAPPPPPAVAVIPQAPPPSPPPPAVAPVAPERIASPVPPRVEGGPLAAMGPTPASTASPVAAPVAEPPASVAPAAIPTGIRSPLPAVEGFVAAEVQSLLGVPSTVQPGPNGTVIWHYLTPSGRQFVYLVGGVATVSAPTATPLVAAARRTPGVQGECEGVTAATGFKNIAVLNAESPLFIEPKFRTQPLTLLAAKKTAEVVSTEGAWYLIRVNDERWGRRVGYIHCSDVVRHDK